MTPPPTQMRITALALNLHLPNVTAMMAKATFWNKICGGSFNGTNY